MTIRHAFVFRHCLRSPEAELDVFDARRPSAYPTRPEDYLSVPLPDWQTSPMGCTARGLEVLQNTGEFLVRSYLPRFGPTHNLRVQFVTDTDQRDVDTSLYMAQGMAGTVQQQQEPQQEQNLSQRQVIHGLQQLTYDAELFNPTRSKWDTQQPTCTEAPRSPWNEYIAERLGTIPRPDHTISQVIQMIERYGGIGSAGSISKLPPTFVNQNISSLGGRIRPIEYLAQSTFYAAASEIPFDVWENNMTPSDLFDLVSWFHWERAVANVGNNHAALVGGVLMDRILRTLDGGGGGGGGGRRATSTDNDDGEDDPDQVAHFFIGHDGDLDHLATVLGITWVLPEPYRSGTNGIWTPTPPHTGIHFSYDDSTGDDADDASVSVSILAPMFFNDNTTSETLVVNKTGILEERPVNFIQHDIDDDNSNNVTITTTVDNGRTVIKSANPETWNVFVALRMHLEQILQTYEGAMDCYQKVVAAQAQAAVVSSMTPAAAPGNTRTTLSPSIVVNGPTTGRPTPTTASHAPHGTAATAAPSTDSMSEPKPKSVKGQALEVWMVIILMATGLFVVLRKIQRRGRRHGGGRHGATYTEMGDARHHELSLEMT